MKLALVSLAAILAAPIAVAQGNLELSGGYSQFDEDGAELGALTGRGTYFFNRYLGAEGEVSIGIDDADVGPATVELEQSFGAFGVLRAPVTERFELFGRAGYATSEFSAEVPGLASASADGVFCTRLMIPPLPPRPKISAKGPFRISTRSML